MRNEVPQVGQRNPSVSHRSHPLPGTPGRRVGWFFFDTIQGTLFLLLFVLLGPVLLVQGLIYYTSINTRLATEHRENVELARAMAATFDAYVQDVLHQELSIGLALTSSRPSSVAEMNRLLAESARGYPSILKYNWVDTQGGIIASSSSASVGTTVDTRTYLQEIAQGRDWVVDDLIAPMAAGEPRFHIARGIRDEKGSLQGVLVAKIEPGHLDEVLGLTRASQGSVSIIDSQGRLVYRYPDVDLTFEGRNVLGAEPKIARALAGEEFSDTIVLMPDERKQIAGHAPIRSIGWVAIASRPEQEVFGPVLQDFWRDFSLVLLTTVLGAIAATMISRNLTVPMKRLRQHALSIGQGKLGDMLDISGPTELEELADAFNRMGWEIQERENQREGYIAELQQAGKALREGEERMTRMFETMTNGVVTFSPDGRMTLVNEAAERILGLPRAEIVKRTHSDVAWKNTTVEGVPLAEEDHPFVRVMRTGKPVYGFEQAFEHPDGTQVLISISAAPLRDEDGTITGVISVLTDITENKRAEQALRQSERKFRSIVERSEDGIVLVDEHGLVIEWNRGQEEITGKKKAEVLGRPLWDVQFEVAPEGRKRPELYERLVGELQEALTTGGGPWLGQLVEREVRRLDGGRCTIQSVTFPIKTDKGFMLGGISRDVTERQRAEETLRQSEERFAKAFRSSPNAFSIGTLAEGRYVDVNDSFLALVGRTREEVIGHTSLELGIWDGPAQREVIIQKLRANRSLHNIERRFRRKTGEVREIISSLEIIDIDGEPHTLAMNLDITERKRAEDAQRFLAEASRQLSTSLDYETILTNVVRLAVPAIGDWCAVDMLSQNDQPGFITVAHVDASKEASARRLHHVWRSVQDRPGYRSNVLHTNQPVLITEISQSDMEAPFDDPEDVRLIREMEPVSSMILPIPVRGHTVGIIAVTSSISGRRYGPADLALMEDIAHRCGAAIDNAQLYRQAQEAVRAREDFLSVAAHELKTPVTSLRGFAQLMLRQLDAHGVPDPLLTRRAMDTIAKQAEKLTQLTYHLLDISRIDAGRLSLERQDTDVTSLVKSVAGVAQASTDRHSINVRAPSSVPAFVDPLRIEQVATNLLDNAIRYSPDGGPIDVELTTPDADTLRLAVTDRGIGIPPEHRQRIFDRFYQAHSSHRLGGMGLGLYISHQIVNLHGGSIDAEFPPEGGTRFVVNLPIGYESVGHAPTREVGHDGDHKGGENKGENG